VFGNSFIAFAIRGRNPLMGIFLTPPIAELIAIIAALAMAGAVR